ncbi:hypothetical protein F4859DRAFT_493531 [Xylaria cf. heliscus]|nr:hypothetical protein F4859DRAFT_493531 [Xylaria cf. heliscus]
MCWVVEVAGRDCTALGKAALHSHSMLNNTAGHLKVRLASRPPSSPHVTGGCNATDTFAQGVILIHRSGELSRTRHPRSTATRAYLDTTNPSPAGCAGKRNEKDGIGVEGEPGENEMKRGETAGTKNQRAACIGRLTRTNRLLLHLASPCLQRQSSLTGMTLQDIGRKCRYKADISAGDRICTQSRKVDVLFPRRNRRWR